jgi:hypothetical protein
MASTNSLSSSIFLNKIIKTIISGVVSSGFSYTLFSKILTKGDPALSAIALTPATYGFHLYPDYSV